MARWGKWDGNCGVPCNPLGEVISVGRVSLATEQPAWLKQQNLSIDLAKPDSIRKVIRAVKPNLIVNAAAYTAVDKAEEQADLALAINGAAPGVLAEEAQQLECGLIHYSTDYVFDGSGEKPWQEDDTPAPINTYGRTKLAGEAAIGAQGAGHLILRVSWVHGVHGANFVKTMLRLAANRTELSIVNDQVGAPTSARVIADATANILAQISSNTYHELKERGGTFHLACQGETNWYEYAQEIFRQARERGLSLAVKQVKPIPTNAVSGPCQKALKLANELSAVGGTISSEAAPLEDCPGARSGGIYPAESAGSRTGRTKSFAPDFSRRSRRLVLISF